ncbi:MAG: aldo/keto reductase [Lachnospiraceae bacterium]|nr:aldo/keto reductase [Lachnospiraceae bacterium]
MSSQVYSLELSNRVKIPCIGFGTWQTPDDGAAAAVRSAVEAGYRHIDTASFYKNEEGVGEGIRTCGVPREELFITTKLWNNDHGYDRTMAAFEDSMKKLGLEYLDLYLIHWPNPKAFRDNWQEANAGSWRAMEELYAAGRVRAIGISNFRPHHIDALMRTANVTPMVNQIRLCPGNPQDEVVSYSRKYGMVLEGYSPLGVGRVFEVPELIALSRKYGRSIAQICLRWNVQRGCIPLPKSVNPDRIRENLDIFDFELDEEDITLISGLTGCAGLENDPDQIPF